MAPLKEEKIKTALVDPSAVFEHPVDVVTALGITDAVKIEILRRWEYDVREEEVAQGENMAGELPVMLSDVLDALHRLGAHADHGHSSPSKQSGL
ncbi:MAG: hypothetical protein IE921_06065 [Rhodobacteraceae bacterium]|nr:hypothetical protein [Paracoccaceae bacterium]